MTAPLLDVCILWHMHQPLYQDPVTGRSAMPWARLHALKDYFDMVALVRKHPGVAVTFNLVPVLLEQLEVAADETKPGFWLQMARRRPEELDAAGKAFLLDSFFSLNQRHEFAAFPRLGELHRKSRGGTARWSNDDWTDADWRDLQTLFHLAWSGTILREEPQVRRLVMKGRHFTEEEKQGLLDRQQAFLKGVIPAYAAARDEGQAELTTTPYYHPILPLLCDLSSVHEAAPGTRLPACPPRAMFDDAREQLVSGLDAFAARFGARPEGMWPAEGSLSDEALGLFDEAGVRWVATDEALLRASRASAPFGASGAPVRTGASAGSAQTAAAGASEIATAAASGSSVPSAQLPVPPLPLPPLAPWVFGSRRTSVFFRDQLLSDLIGFSYSTWRAASAAGDLVGRLEAIASRANGDSSAPGGRRPVVSIILDGENAWESYPGNGSDFLDALYDGLSQSKVLRATTFSRHLADYPATDSLPRLSAGSWIHGNFLTWIGHPEKNRAWELLAAARAAFEEAGRPEEARRWLRAAQGSDWFWWFGDDHSSAQDASFDALFRGYLARVHEACGQEPPAALAHPIKKHSARRHVVDPVAPVRITVDGRVTDFFEWLGCGTALAEPASAAIHTNASPVKSLSWGADETTLALRFDPAGPAGPASRGGVDAAAVEIAVTSPGSTRARYALDDPAIRSANGKVLEVAVPLAGLNLAVGDRAEFSVTLLGAGGDPIASFPADGTLSVTIAPFGDTGPDWSA